MKECVEGSHAIAEIVKLCRPAVVSAYPITPQTHIVEDLSQFKADGEADFEFIRSESEFAAASIVLGASASGVRTYTATSSQGLLLMAEVIFTISGMRLPVVLTCANRAVSAPINIWNDQQDAMTVRDSGWIMLFAEDNQEAVDFHLLAFKLAEHLQIPVMVNVDGFILTHTFEPLEMPSAAQVKKFLPDYNPSSGQFLDVKNPKSLGCFATPDDYFEIRKDLFDDLQNSKVTIVKELNNFSKAFKRNNAELVEYYGKENAETVFVAMGSVGGTIKDTIDELSVAGASVSLARIKCFRPFPREEIFKKLSFAKNVAVIDKSVSLGQEGIIATEVKAVLLGTGVKVQSCVAGLGGRDITREMLKDVLNKIQGDNSATLFVGLK